MSAYKSNIIYFGICCVLIKTLLVSEVIAQQQCGTAQWDCNNGQCISANARCDGMTDCQDGSDETAENCIQGYATCHAFGFKCAYGACVADGYRCNGRKDCADNSDELVCDDKKLDKLQGNCSSGTDFECSQSNECISKGNMCNGIKDCADGSDETLQLCVGFDCPDGAFHCGYGACISGTAKCNGVRDCADGSDEAWELCGYPRPVNKATSSLSDTRDENKCQLPENYPHLVARLHPQNETIPLGAWVGNYEIVHLECSNGYRIMTDDSLNCQNGKWTAEFPTCAEYCDGLSLLGLSTFYVCINNFMAARQCTRVQPNTEVIVGCNVGYEGFGNTSPLIRCTSDGKFTAKRPTCNVECGVLRQSTPLTKEGFQLQRNEVPWQVAIYRKPDKTNYKFVCGGSIISPSVIVTAAHCFWDVAVQEKMNADVFQVAAGKYYRDYDTAKDPTAQISDIAEIAISPSFQYGKDKILEDIAVVKLKTPFVFNENISAVCLRFDARANSYVPNDWAGTIVGYGDTDTEYKRIQRVPMKSLSFHSCQLRQQANLADDKFCLQNEDSATVCRGDSGGGFVIQNAVTKRHELLGVISYTRFSNAECVREGILTATNVNYMSDEVVKKMEQFKQEDKALF